MHGVDRGRHHSGQYDTTRVRDRNDTSQPQTDRSHSRHHRSGNINDDSNDIRDPAALAQPHRAHGAHGTHRRRIDDDDDANHIHDDADNQSKSHRKHSAHSRKADDDLDEDGGGISNPKPLVFNSRDIMDLDNEDEDDDSIAKTSSSKRSSKNGSTTRKVKTEDGSSPADFLADPAKSKELSWSDWAGLDFSNLSDGLNWSDWPALDLSGLPDELNWSDWSSLDLSDLPDELDWSDWTNQPNNMPGGSKTPKSKGSPDDNGPPEVDGSPPVDDGPPAEGASKLAANIPKQMEPLRADIEHASEVTGIPANRLAAKIWAESRDNLQHPEASKNPDPAGPTYVWDVGVSQISQGRYDNDVKKSMGGPELDVNKQRDNILAGALELKQHYQENHNDWHAAHAAYRGVGDGKDGQYADAVERYFESLNAGKGLVDGSGF